MNYFKSAFSALVITTFLTGCQSVTQTGTSTHTPKKQLAQTENTNTVQARWQEQIKSARELRQKRMLEARERREELANKRKAALEERKKKAAELRKARIEKLKTGKSDKNQKKINTAFAKAVDKKDKSLRVGWVKIDGKFVYRSAKTIREEQEAARKAAELAAKKAAARKAAAKRAASSKRKSASTSRKSYPKGNYSKLIAKYAAQNGIPYRLARAVVQVESSFRPNVTGSVGEIGLMQIRLSTARGMGYKGTAKQLYNPSTNLYWGMKYLGKAHRLAGGSTCGTILKYNAGHGAKRMNPISQRYCNRVRRII
jgi:soluble lytic murein transglycosylase-like protein